MTLRRFLLIDSMALDVAGVGALVAGEMAFAIVLFVAAAITFVAFLAAGARRQTVTA